MRRDTIQGLMKFYTHHLEYKTEVASPLNPLAVDGLGVDRSATNNQDIAIAGDIAAFMTIDREVRAWCLRHSRALSYDTIKIILCFSFNGAKKNGLKGFTRDSYGHKREDTYKALESYLLEIESIRELIREPDGVVLG